MTKHIFKIRTDRLGWMSTVVSSTKGASEYLNTLRDRSQSCGVNDSYSLEHVRPLNKGEVHKFQTV